MAFHFKQRRGFTVFLAMLIAALALSIGLAIYDLISREIDLSDTASQSQYAIYAADSGVECALYWDNKATALNGATSDFATSTGNGNASPPSSGVSCANQDVAALGTPPSPYVAPPSSGNGWTQWSVVGNGSAATTTFTVVLGNTTQSACAVVSVAKSLSGSVPATTITSRGYNTCASTALSVQRALQVNY